MNDTATHAGLQRRLLQSGVTLLLLGLLTGFTLPLLENPRMGLSSHLEGVMNGMLLIGFGLLWPHLMLTSGQQKLAAGLAVFGAYVNWLATLLAGIWGAGGEMMPLAASGLKGTPVQEGLIALALISLSISMIAVCVLALWGLRARSA